jgi:hypothetical protein
LWAASVWTVIQPSRRAFLHLSCSSSAIRSPKIVQTSSCSTLSYKHLLGQLRALLRMEQESQERRAAERTRQLSIMPVIEGLPHARPVINSGDRRSSQQARRRRGDPGAMLSVRTVAGP